MALVEGVEVFNTFWKEKQTQWMCLSLETPKWRFDTKGQWVALKKKREIKKQRKIAPDHLICSSF